MVLAVFKVMGFSGVVLCIFHFHSSHHVCVRLDSTLLGKLPLVHMAVN